MKFDYIHDGSHDGPFFRLVSERKDEIMVLQDVLKMLGTSQLNEVNVSGLPISESKLNLTFKLCQSDSGMRKSKDRNEYCVSLSNETYLEMAEKLAPFINNQTGYAWLYESGLFYILFTTDGYW